MTNLDIQNALVGNTQVDKLYLGADVIWPTTPVYSAMPLTFEIISGGTITWKSASETFTQEIEYSIDNGQTWTAIVSSTAGTEINVNASDKIQFRGNAIVFSGETSRNCFRGTALFNAYGNPLSIRNKTDFATITSLNEMKYAFAKLFHGCTGLVDASNLALVATELETYCYQNMFDGCANLINAPKLPAAVLKQGCYYQMFFGCSNLSSAPDLLAPTLVSNCYRQMFIDCTKLNYIKCLATNPQSSGLTNPFNQAWVRRVAGSGTFIKSSNASWSSGDNGIPNGWTVQDAVIN